MKVVILFDFLGPYHRARLSAVAHNYELVAVEVSEGSADYAWERLREPARFRLVTLMSKGKSRRATSRELEKRLRATLDELQPEAVMVPGWSSIAAFAALRWCLRHGVRAIAMSESNWWDEERVGWKEWVKRRLLAVCSAALVGGRPQRDYLIQLGMPAERIFFGYDAVDNRYFESEAESARRKAPELRQRYGLPERYFLASARFVEKKNLPRLIQAYAGYRDLSAKRQAPSAKRTEPWHLVLLGDGPLRDSLCALRSALGVQDSVLLPGFKQYPELPTYYGLASAFVHASTTEQWGLVVNEAMASGLPVLVSNRCGCAPDLVKETVNGFTFDPYDSESLAQLMFKMSAFNFPLAEYGSMSRETVARFGPEAFASGFDGAVRAALATPRKPADPFHSLLLRALSVASRPQGHPAVPFGSSAEIPIAAHNLEDTAAEAVKNLFSESAVDYSELFQPKRRGSNFEFRKRLAIASELARPASGRLLDCASGTGEITAAVLKSGRFSSATVVDFSQRMLESAQSQIRRSVNGETVTCLDFVCSDVFEFVAKHSHGRFDLILCLGLVAHTGRIEELLDGLKGMLTGNGTIAIQTTLLDHFGVRIVRAFTRGRYYRRHGYRISYYRNKDIIDACRRTGLVVAAQRRYLVGLPFGDRIWSWGNYYLEKNLQPLAGALGAEAIYLLRSAPDA